MNSCRYLVVLLGLSSVACGPRVSQWVVVTECEEKHVIIPEATVWVYEGAAPDEAMGLGAVGYSAHGGETNTQGHTWVAFPQKRGSAIMADLSRKKGENKTQKNPVTRVPAGAPQPVYACIPKAAR
jgi:hypothetical protein